MHYVLSPLTVGCLAAIGLLHLLFLSGFTKADDATGHSDGKPLLEAQLKKYAIGWALLTADDTRIPFFAELGWKRAYADDDAVIYLPPGA